MEPRRSRSFYEGLLEFRKASLRGFRSYPRVAANARPLQDGVRNSRKDGDADLFRSGDHPTFERRGGRARQLVARSGDRQSSRQIHTCLPQIQRGLANRDGPYFLTKSMTNGITFV